MKKTKVREGFHVVDGSVGIILDSILLKDDGSEIVIKKASGGEWHFKPLNESAPFPGR